MQWEPDEHDLKLTTDEVEDLTELLEYATYESEHLERIRWKLGVIREEPRDPDVDARFS